jgi:hypothetical protein
MWDMVRKVSVFLLMFFVSTLMCITATARQNHKAHPAASKKEAPQPQVAATPAPPAAEPTPEQMPAVPAQVTYKNNQLTILARNSTVGDILRAVRSQTGASVDAPPDAKQRIVGQFGPGPARDVLASVLDASGFNYVLLGSATNPNALQSVIVTVKSNEPVTTTPAPPEPVADNSQADQSDQPTETDDAEPNPPSESFAPPDSDSNDADSSQDQTQPPPKTPEQLLQELQRQQQIQQMQLQQQQQNGGSQENSIPQDQMHQNQR